ncbi:MAG: PspC domain-containing protein [Acidobacteriaceae bacterium]|nr:PspC domain-containing protein [Acidobacteriaceae bacterium]
MYCTSCGTQITTDFRHCPQCGAVTGAGATAPGAAQPAKQLSRPREGRKIAGVCAGIARYTGVDVTLIRILMVVFTFWPPGVAPIAYLVCWIVMPNDPLLLPPPQTNGQTTTVVPG